MNAASTSTTTATTTTVNLVPYQPPSWASGLGDPPTARVHLRDTNDPTPIEPFPLHLDHASSLCAGGAAGKFGSIEQILRAVCDNQVRIYLKRDDLSGLQVSGNKVRKLEFLFAHALLHGYDSVATVGCNQSNHCRTTAVAANRMRLPCHVILRTPEPLEPAAFALEGNVLLNKLAGASMHLVSRADYLSHGGARGVLDLVPTQHSRSLLRNVRVLTPNIWRSSSSRACEHKVTIPFRSQWEARGRCICTLVCCSLSLYRARALPLTMPIVRYATERNA